jgi:L-cysteine desulfidase
MITKETYSTYINILKQELIPAMGCTEPIAIAYAAAVAAKTLEEIPQKIVIEVSGNIIKNVKSVIVPHTGGLRGIKAAVAAGIVAGKPEKELEVISEVSNQQILEMEEFLNKVPCEVQFAKTPYIFDIMITVFGEKGKAYVRILDFHTNIVRIEKDDEVILSKTVEAKKVSNLSDKSLLNVEDIIEFANTVDISEMKETLDRQIEYNTAIANEGLRGNYGANIGNVLLKTYGNDDVKVRAKAKAAAGSDARMNGCELPVIINSGSGNQGITASVPVIEYAKELGVSKELEYRALVISNLLTIHLKTGIGRLSAYCGVVSAGCGSGAAIAYLYGGEYDEIAHTVVNALAIASGIICDGAKASCAAKIAAAVDIGILGYHMYKEGQEFLDGDGIVKKGVENTISNIGKLARNGMGETDKEIIRIMIGD